MNDNTDDIKIIDCFGDICPIPMIKIENQLKAAQTGDRFMIVTDHSCTLESIRYKYEKKSVVEKIEEVINGVWEVTFIKR